MNVLITGGTGLIGRVLAAELLAQGNQVTVLTRNPEKRSVLPPGINLVAWDGKSPDGWGHLVESTDVIINLAGASIAGENLPAIVAQRWSDENKRLILESRLNAGQALTMAIQAAEHKPKVLVQASAVGVYGPHGAESLDEETPPGRDYFLAAVCKAWEDSTRHIEELGVRRVIIRTGLVMTTGGGILPMMLLPFRLFAGGVLGSGEQVISWVYIRDVVEAILFLLEDVGSEGAYNLTAPNPVTYEEFANIAGKLMRRPAFLPVPSFALRFILGEKATLVLDGQRVLPKRLLAAGYDFHFEEMDLALRHLLNQK
jgi:uncharacterized protein (TIGR01777 family)